MGAADVVPGVSGGTMAFILGIYEEFIDAIKSFDRLWFLSIMKLNISTVINRPKFKFILPLAAGIAIALVFFTRVIPLPELLQEYPEQVYGLFFGLIAGSTFILLVNIKNVKLIDLVFVITGVVPGLLLFNIGPVSIPDTSIFVFLSGCVSISAMLLPGISGSFILLILNKYTYIFNAIGYFNLSVLLPFFAGMVTGLVIFSRILSWVLHRFYRNTTLIITGILISSLWLIWPFQDRVYETIGTKMKLVSSTPMIPYEFNSALFLTIMLALIGIFVVIFIHTISRKKSLL
ncbi:MAG: putative membrane protein [Gammaproteobacteria bacterium]|jgi:putative membrane protein